MKPRGCSRRFASARGACGCQKGRGRDRRIDATSLVGVRRDAFAFCFDGTLSLWGLEGRRCAAASLGRRAPLLQRRRQQGMAARIDPRHPSASVALTAACRDYRAFDSHMKGFAVADFLSRFHSSGCGPSGCPSVRNWYSNLTQIKSNTFLACGYCRDCKLPPPTWRHHVHRVRVHAFELLSGNQMLLKLLFERFNVPGAVHAMALSNFTGSVWRPTFVRTGQENSHASITSGGRGFDRLDTTSVDAYSREHGVGRIAWLSLDAEGWDPLIIDGATRMLRERRVDLLEFEYAPVGWALTMGAAETKSIRLAGERLDTLLEWLHTECGYTCFWQGGRSLSAWAGGKAVQINPTDRTAATQAAHADRLVNASLLTGCAVAHVGNLVCAHAPPVVAALHALAK